MRHATAAVFVTMLLAGVGLAQEDTTVRRVDVRVVSMPIRGTVVIDRGRTDQLELGDSVEFRPRQGGSFRGLVIRVEERQGVVELADDQITLAPGTRGEALIPTRRFAPRPAPVQQPPVQEPPVPQPEPRPEPAREDPRPALEEMKRPPPVFQNQDRDYTPDQPLLSQANAVRPEQRSTRLSGRIYAIGQFVQHPESGRDESFFRVGTALRVDNPFQGGGTFKVHTEVNHRTEYDDDSGSHLLVHELSYTTGGTRFADQRWQFGRFLQYQMPEFGIVDGVEWSHRLANGSSFGASFGFMPEPDAGHDGTSDIQFSAHYRWVSDLQETTMFGVGFQKTLHDGRSDRDLFVIKGHSLPKDDWHLHGTLWIDIYGGDDDIRGPGVDVSQALISLTRRYDDNSRLMFSYRRLALPEIKRFEFLPLLPDEWARDRADRLSVEAWSPWSDKTMVHGYLAAVSDEWGVGGAFEAGVETADLLRDGSRTDFTVFGQTGQYTSVLGARAQFDLADTNGRFSIFYEAALHHETGFPNNRDDLLHHRVRFSRDLFQVLGGDLTVHAEAMVWGDDISWTAGFTFQRNF